MRENFESLPLQYVVELPDHFVTPKISPSFAAAAQLELMQKRRTTVYQRHIECNTDQWAPDVTVYGRRGLFLATVNQIHVFNYHAANPHFQQVLDLLNSPGTTFHELRHAYNASWFFRVDGPWDYYTFALDEITARLAEYLAVTTQMGQSGCGSSVGNIDVDYPVAGNIGPIIASGVRHALDALEASDQYPQFWHQYNKIKHERLVSSETPLSADATWAMMRTFSINGQLIDIYDYITPVLRMRMEGFLRTPPRIPPITNMEHTR